MKAYRRQIRMVSSGTRFGGAAARRAGGKKSSIELAGSAHVFMLAIVLIIFVAGGCYLYSVNRSAVQGYHMRTLEKEIDKLKQENAELKIAEADLRSLYRIESSEEALGMQKLDTVVYLEERGPVALLK